MPLLEHAQKPHLHAGRHLADLVEKQRPLPGHFEKPLFEGHGSGKGPLLVAEKFAGQQLLGKRPAVDGQKPVGALQAGGMDGPGHQLLARAGLAEDEHRGVGGRDVADVFGERLDGRAFANNQRPAPQLGHLPRQPGHLQAQPAFVHGLGHRGPDLGQAVGLGQIVAGPQTHGLHGRGHRGVAGHDHHLGVRPQPFGLPEHGQPVQALHAQVRQNQIKLPISKPDHGRLAAGRRNHVVALPGQDVAEVFHGNGLVVDHQHRRALHAASVPARGRGRRMTKRAPRPPVFSAAMDP